MRHDGEPLPTTDLATAARRLLELKRACDDARQAYDEERARVLAAMTTTDTARVVVDGWRVLRVPPTQVKTFSTAHLRLELHLYGLSSLDVENVIDKSWDLRLRPAGLRVARAPKHDAERA